VANVDPSPFGAKERVATTRAPVSRSHRTNVRPRVPTGVRRHEGRRARSVPRELAAPYGVHATRTVEAPERRVPTAKQVTTPHLVARRHADPHLGSRRRAARATTRRARRESRGRIASQVTTRHHGARQHEAPRHERARALSTGTRARPRHSRRNNVSVKRLASALGTRGGGASLVRARSTSTARVRS
jgi:hypothetical protein